LGQESIATLTSIPGFGAVPSHDEVCRQLLLRCTQPLTEVLEYIKRDVANLALGNKDNHARNTAVQRDFSGGIRLTPLYDFAPMYLHPDGIARRIRWEANDGGAPDWSRVIDKVCELAQALMADKQTPTAQRKALREITRPTLIEGLRLMVEPLEKIAAHGIDFGLEPAVFTYLKLGIQAQAQRLANLH
jgi:serine/threonine-protein kinase HipA